MLFRKNPAPGNRHALCLLSLILLCCPQLLSAGGGPRNVLVVVNTASDISQQIGDYYIKARGIPPGNVCHISCSTDELVSKAECENNIVAPIRAFLEPHIDAKDGSLKRDCSYYADYIVLTKGIPLAADYGYSTGPASVTSVLTCVRDFNADGVTPKVTTCLTNPYGTGNSSATSFSHWTDTSSGCQLTLYGGHSLYLVTRLDGYTLDDVKALIDRSRTDYTGGGTVLLDGNGGASLQDRNLGTANTTLLSRGINTIFDNSSAFLGNANGLIGYFSWGSNGSGYNPELYKSNTFLPGSIADTYVSSSARTFNDPLSPGQSLMADLISLGACGVCGAVSEPYTAYLTYPNILFDRYTRGYNAAESFYLATPKLYWKSAIIADPLMAPFASAPSVAIVPPTPENGGTSVQAKLASDPVQIILTGQSTLVATASSSSGSGISKVEFFVDGSYVGESSSAPYTVAIDTTKYPVGPHNAEAVAYDSGPTRTQASAQASIIIENQTSNLLRIADAYSSEDGQGVKANDRVVIADTASMGGNEFYISDPDRSAGMRIISSRPVRFGDTVTIVGRLTTDNGERGIIADSVVETSSGSTLITPLGMPSKFVGGIGPTPQTPGITGAVGLRNTGLLIKTWGTVTYAGTDSEDFFYINDGASTNDGSRRTGLKVKSRTLPKPSVGSMVTVTGISSCELVDGRTNPVVKVRTADDIALINP